MAKKFEDSTLNGKNRSKYHSSSCICEPTCRRPSSVFFANRFRSAACQKIQLPPGGSQELISLWSLPFNEPLSCVGWRAATSRPYPVRWKPGAGGANLAKYEHNPRKMSNGMVDDSDFFRYNGHKTTQIVAYSLRI